MLKNTSGQHISFIAIATADGSPVTTGTPTVYISKDGQAQATSTNTAAHLGNGVWVLDLTQAETDADNLSAVMVLTNAINSFAQAFPYVLADFKANVSGLSTFDPATDAVANVTTVATCTTNSDMRGTDGANTVAPDNAGISANGTAIAALNDFDPSSDVVARVTLVDTVTVNTDMRGTDGANTIAPDNAGITANGNAIAALNNFDPASDVVNANVQSIDTDAIDAASIKSDAITEIQTGLITIGSAFTHTNQAGDSMTVTIT